MAKKISKKPMSKKAPMKPSMPKPMYGMQKKGKK